MKRLHILVLGGLGLLASVPAFANDTVYYYYNDAQGSPVAVTDASGNVVERTQYAPYGQVLNRPEHDGPGYTKHEEDAATGLTNMQQRYDDKAIGRMLSLDPVDVDPGTGANFNRYAYASDNPYRYTDPNGEMSAPGPASACTPGPYCGHAERGALVTVSGPVVDVGLHDPQSEESGGARSTPQVSRSGPGLNSQNSGSSNKQHLEFITEQGNNVYDPWIGYFELAHASKRGGWIVQHVQMAGAGEYNYWEAWRVPPNSRFTANYPYYGYDDMFAGPHGLVIQTSARFYEGLTLPSSFYPHPKLPSTSLPATTIDPHLSTEHATDSVDRWWTW